MILGPKFVWFQRVHVGVRLHYIVGYVELFYGNTDFYWGVPECDNKCVLGK